MGRMSFAEKSERVARFLIGLRDKAVVAQLRRFKFTDKDLKEGWALLQAAGVAPTGGTTSDSENLIRQIDEFENLWFPVVSATLQRRFPATHAILFNNLSQTTGPAVAVTVGTLLERVEMMAKGVGAYGPEGQAAYAAIQGRGFTSEVIDGARALLARLSEIMPEDGSDAQEAAAEKAEADLWNWYLEWSEISRSASLTRSQLRSLGFLKARKPSSSPDAGEDEEEEEPGGGFDETGACDEWRIVKQLSRDPASLTASRIGDRRGIRISATRLGRHHENRREAFSAFAPFVPVNAN